MTDDQELDLILGRWLSDGPVEMPDRVIEMVTTGISRQRQRPAWRLDRRYLTMNPLAKAGAAIAAVALIALVGYNLLPGGFSGIGGPAPTASPTAAPTPTLSVVPSAAQVDPVMPEGTLLPGRYRITPFPSAPGLTMSLTAPAGWQGFQNWALLGPAGTDPPSGVGLAVLRVDGLFRDPCQWDRAKNGDLRQLDVAVGPTVDDLVGALRADTAYTVSTPTPVTVGGYGGQRLDLLVPAAVDLSACDEPTQGGDPNPRYFVFTGANGEAGLYAQGPASRWHLTILDVGGTRVVIVNGDYARTSAADQAAAQAIVDSMEFAP